MRCKGWRRRKQGDLRTEDRMVKEDPVQPCVAGQEFFFLKMVSSVTRKPNTAGLAGIFPLKGMKVRYILWS
jgi:hypothetical protein